MADRHDKRAKGLLDAARFTGYTPTQADVDAALADGVGHRVRSPLDQ